MKRFVSYLYSIFNNQKIHNSGFARIELRAGRNRIDIHLRESGYSGKSGTVYLFVRKNENIQGISIGNIIFRNNQADFHYEQPEENIGQTSWQIMQMNGIVVLIDGQVTFLSQWDEEPVDTARFQEWNAQDGADKKESESQDNIKKDDTKKDGSENIAQAEKAQAPENIAQAEKVQAPENSIKAGVKNNTAQTVQKMPGSSDMPQNQYQNNNAIDAADQAQADIADHVQTAIADQAHADAADQAQACRGRTYHAKYRINRHKPSASNIQTAEIQPQPAMHQWEQTWRHMLRMYPVLNQFADQSHALCVRIEIKDVRLLPEKYWSIVNNSFLLHGFFNYRYLIFGRIGQNWMIGIPGIYQNQEHAMASIFGFPDFLPQAQKDGNGEQPGYWYRILEIS